MKIFCPVNAGRPAAADMRVCGAEIIRVKTTSSVTRPHQSSPSVLSSPFDQWGLRTELQTEKMPGPLLAGPGVPSHLCLDVRPAVCRDWGWGWGRVPTQCAQYLSQGLKAVHQPKPDLRDERDATIVCLSGALACYKELIIIREQRKGGQTESLSLSLSLSLVTEGEPD